MKSFQYLGLLLLFLIPTVLAAVNFDQPPSAEDQQQFDAILAPIMKIYGFIKYAAVVIAVLVMAFAGISFVTSGGEMAKKEAAKNMAMYVVIGLIVIWVAPFVVNYIFS